jgi:hypothetical protein
MASTRTLLSLALAAAIAAPALAHAQRTGSTSTGSSGSSSGSTSSGGDQRTVPAGSQPVGTSVPRGSTPSTSSPSGSGGSSQPASTSGSGGRTTPRDTGTPATGGAGATSTTNSNFRNRGGRPNEGTATDRVAGQYGYAFNPFSPWGRYYPWYSVGLGLPYGFVSFDPYWTFGSTRYIWNRYGMWGYYPGYYDPYGYGYGYGSAYGGYGYGGDSRREDVKKTGSVRIKISPDKAQVFVDGVLAGTAADFGGFSHHLEIAGGTHLLEFKLDGYQTLSSQVDVTVGETTTYRGSLKKK